MPFLNLPLPVLRLLRSITDTEWAACSDSVAAAQAIKLGLIERRSLDIDGKLEVSHRITDAGRRALGADRAGRAELPSAGKAPTEADLGGKPSCLVPIFGSNRTLADKVGEELEGCAWVGVPFVGGLSELPWIGARTIVAGDTHGHLINLARVAADPELSPLLQAALSGILFHEDSLRESQERCQALEHSEPRGLPSVGWAADYFVCAWMARNSTAGTKGEFRAPLSVRWDAGGGDSVKRFRNAAVALPTWLELLAGRVTFVCQDAFEFLTKVKDREGHGVYADPPFPGSLGKSYKHGFGDEQWAQLAEHLGAFEETCVVVRCHDVPLARKLFTSKRGWVWRELVGRNQARERSPEVLIVKNGGS